MRLTTILIFILTFLCLQSFVITEDAEQTPNDSKYLTLNERRAKRHKSNIPKVQNADVHKEKEAEIINTTEAKKKKTKKVRKHKLKKAKVDISEIEKANVEIPKVEKPKVQSPQKEKPKVQPTKVVQKSKVHPPKEKNPKKQPPKEDEPKVQSPKVAEKPKVQPPKEAEKSKIHPPKEEKSNKQLLKEKSKVQPPKLAENQKVQPTKVIEKPKVNLPKEEKPKVNLPKEEKPKKQPPKEEKPKVQSPKVVENPKVEPPKIEKSKELESIFKKDNIVCYETITDGNGKKVCDLDSLLRGVNGAVDQMSCPACWAFAMTALVEAKHYQVTRKVVKISEGFFVDCLGGNGCAGGHPKDGFRYLQLHQYAPGYQTYPWTGGYTGGCKDTDHLHNVLGDVWLTRYRKIAETEGALEEALISGPVIINNFVSRQIFKYTGPGLWDDTNCIFDPNPHSMLVIGYTADYWLVKNSYGDYWGIGGFVKMARTKTAISCNMLKDMYTVDMIKRREIEYVIGKGMKTFADAQAYCKEIGDTLAVIPTKYHEEKVLKMFQEKYGAELKSNPSFNSFWIDIGKAKKATTWDDTDIPLEFQEFDYGEPRSNTVSMNKADGDWKGHPKNEPLRFVCSRFR